jgi:hypothetical protein
MSAATEAASCCGEREEGPTMRSVSQRKMMNWAPSTTASSVMNPKAIRQ